MFHRKNKYDLEKLQQQAAGVFENYNSGTEYFEHRLKPVVLDLYRAFTCDAFKSIDEVLGFVTPLKRVASYPRALLCASILKMAGNSMAATGPFGEYFVTLVASNGITGAQESARAVTESKDANSSHSLKIALDIYWRHTPTPHRELEHAQSTYLHGILAYAVDGNKLEFRSLLQSAIALLSTVDPDRAGNQVTIEFMITSKAKLQMEWEDQLVNLK